MKNFYDTKDRVALTERINKLTAGSERLWGSMTVSQTVCHMTDQLRMTDGKIKTKPVGTVIYRTLLKWLVLTIVKAPKGKIKTVPEIDQDKQGTKPTEFARDVAQLFQMMDRFASEENKVVLYPHPAFGKLTKWQWGRLIYLHMDHHLRQFGI
ncbi:MAG: DUF1569 domain-containing protein [Ignavibacteria bacterium]